MSLLDKWSQTKKDKPKPKPTPTKKPVKPKPKKLTTQDLLDSAPNLYDTRQIIVWTIYFLLTGKEWPRKPGYSKEKCIAAIIDILDSGDEL